MSTKVWKYNNKKKQYGFATVKKRKIVCKSKSEVPKELNISPDVSTRVQSGSQESRHGETNTGGAGVTIADGIQAGSNFESESGFYADGDRKQAWTEQIS